MTTTERLREGLRQFPSWAFDTGVDFFHASRDRHRANLRERFMEELIRQEVFGQRQKQTQKQAETLERVVEIFDAVLQSPFEPYDKWAKRHENPAPEKRVGGNAR